MAKTCPVCKFSNDDDVSFCRSCGHPLDDNLNRILEAERITKAMRTHEPPAVKQKTEAVRSRRVYEEEKTNIAPLIIAAVVVAAIIVLVLFL